MGQYWTMRNLDKGQELGTHALGACLKYVEQWFSGPMYTAMMLLLTDKSSLGEGDIQLDKVPDELKPFLEIIGSWAGDRVVFAGHYTKVNAHRFVDEDNEDDEWEDISAQVALAAWTIVLSEDQVFDQVLDDGDVVKGKLLDFLEKEVCRLTDWQGEVYMKRLFDAIDEMVYKRDFVEDAAAAEAAAAAAAAAPAETTAPLTAGAAAAKIITKWSKYESLKEWPKTLVKPSAADLKAEVKLRTPSAGPNHWDIAKLLYHLSSTERTGSISGAGACDDDKLWSLARKALPPQAADEDDKDKDADKDGSKRMRVE